MDLAYRKMVIAVQASKLLVVLNINSAQQVNQLEEGSEIQAHVVIQINAVEIFQGVN